jgi:hypothetical protein
LKVLDISINLIAFRPPKFRGRESRVILGNPGFLDIMESSGIDVEDAIPSIG